MRINTLHLQNFRQHVDTRLEFDTGLTGIIGPNGSGKSTILEAVAWALYGMPAARGTRESIRSHRAGARASVRVELDFELGGHRYRVVRGLTNAELYLDGASQPIANSITGVTDLLRRRLGMSLEEFFNTYFTGQKELSVMAAMGPSERAQFLSRVLGYEKLRAAQNLVRERRRIIMAESAGLRAGMPDPDSVARMLADAERRLTTAVEQAHAAGARRTATRAALDAITPRWESLQRERELAQKLIADLRVAENDEAAGARDAERVDRELGEIATARLELERTARELEPLAHIVGRLQQLDALLREEGRRQTLVESERSLADELLTMRERRTRIETAPQFEEEVTVELERARKDLEAVEGLLESARTDWVRDRQEAETKKAALLQQYNELRQQREQLVQLGEDSPCPTCTRPLGASYRSVLELVDSQLETVQVDGKYYRSRIEQLEEMPAEVKELDERRRSMFDGVGKLERRLAKVQLAVQELAQLQRDVAQKEQRHAQIQRDLAAIPTGYDAVEHAKLRAELERLQPLDAKAARLSAQVEREPMLRRERERVTERAAQVARTVADLRRQRDDVRFSDESFASVRVEYERAAAELRDAELAGVGADSEAAAAAQAREVADRARQELDRSKAQLDALTQEKRLHDELDRAYSDMRTDLNLQLRPEISELASSFLTELTDARYSELELDDQYNVIVLEDGIPKPVISGGEEDLANLVLRLAISQMIAERAGQSFSLLILDEIFGSLDESRRHNVVELLRRLQDRFEQVILITHIESVREGLDRVITVRFDEETASSRVDQEEPGGGVDTGLVEQPSLAAGAAD